MSIPRRRKDALDQDLPKYFTGKPCVWGHIAERYSDSGVCSVCLRHSVDRYQTENHALVRSKTKQWRKVNSQYYKQYYAKNGDRVRSHSRKWKEANPDRVALLADNRREALRQATPPWFEHNLVQEVYLKRDELSSLLNVDLTVDHIVPIQGDDVCGLHCWSNLQLIERSENGRKGNRYERT